MSTQLRHTLARAAAGLALAVLFVLQTWAEPLRLPAIFTDHAVLQQKAPIAVWGWGEPGQSVIVTLAGGMSTTQIADDGRWSLTLPAMNAGGPHILKVASGDATVALSDILIGEVWLASGQSNMQWSIKATDNWEAELAQCANDNIRFAMVYREVSPAPLDDLRKLTPWAACTAESMADCYDGAGFSAVSYYFAKHLQAELGIPVGVINTSWGGTRIEPWTPPEAFAALPSLADIDQLVRINTPNGPEYQSALNKAIADVKAWVPNAEQALAAGNFAPALPNIASKSALDSSGSPTALFNAMVAPLIPYGSRGFIWYQGESNRGEGMLYRDKMEALINGWRGRWKQDDLACYFVQLAPYDYGSIPRALPEIWEAQTATLAIPHTGMAVINDIGNIKNIHPTNKDDVGKRLALLALKDTYGRNDLKAESPLYDRFEVSGNTMRVHFKHAESLKTRDGNAPTWFTLAGPEGVYHEATATLDGATVLLTAEGVDTPVAVRFAWDHIAEPNLMNEVGLPASAFRAGSVPLDGALRHHVPEAAALKLLYAFDPTNPVLDNNRVQYDEDHRQDFAGKTIERVAYFMQLVDAEEQTRWVYVEMAPFTQDVARLGVPAPEPGSVFQQDVQNLFVKSSEATLPAGALATGNIEFWASNYGPQAARKLPGASEELYDFDDAPSAETSPGYGSLQIHDPASSTTLLAFNNFRAGRDSDVGIGNNPSGQPDWTFSKSAGGYSSGSFLVLVKIAE